jgi:hypothetical protein
VSSVKNPVAKKAKSLKKDHRVFTLEGNKTFRGQWRKKKRRLAKKERRAAQRILRSRSGEEQESPKRQIPRALWKLGAVSLERALAIRKHEPQQRFSTHHGGRRYH